MKPTDPQGAAGTHHSSPEELHNEGVAHEHSDVDVRSILGFGVIVAVVTVVCALIVWGVFGFLEMQAAGRDPKQSPVAMPATEMPRTTAGSPYFGTAPQPQLITSEPTVLRMQREAEDSQLHQYGWVDQKGGVARVPIDEAKKLIAERGLPSRPGGADPQLGTHAPAFGEASGGRSIPTRERAVTAPPAPPAAATPSTPKEPAAPAPAGRGGGA